jgi:predicted dehydrogenase
VADFLADIAAGRDPSPSFREGLQVQRVLDAVERSSAEESRWTPVPTS